MVLLFVCTGNVCRSPMAAAFAEALLKERGQAVSVASAGTLDGGRPATDDAVEVMSRRGLDLRSHLSRSLNEALRKPPDLVIAMGRDHARAVVGLAPELFPRTFTLKEAVRRAGSAGPRQASESLEEYLARLNSGREISDLAGIRTSDDVPDPIGQGRKAYKQAADQISRLVSALVENMWPSSDPIAKSS